jgi:hypothetical protein
MSPESGMLMETFPANLTARGVDAVCLVAGTASSHLNTREPESRLLLPLCDHFRVSTPAFVHSSFLPFGTLALLTG